MSPLVRLYLREGSLSILSLSSYDRSLMPGTNLVALRCTFSSVFDWRINCGYQTNCPYSRLCIINALYSFRKISLLINEKFLFISPIILLAFFTTELICRSNFKVLSNMTPKSFSSVHVGISLPPWSKSTCYMEYFFQNVNTYTRNNGNTVTICGFISIYISMIYH